MLPRAAQLLRSRIAGGNLGLRDPRSIVQGRNTLFAMFGGKVPLRQAQVRPSGDGANSPQGRIYCCNRTDLQANTRSRWHQG
jgi:hypothetical protein